MGINFNCDYIFEIHLNKLNCYGWFSHTATTNNHQFICLIIRRCIILIISRHLLVQVCFRILCFWISSTWITEHLYATDSLLTLNNYFIGKNILKLIKLKLKKWKIEEILSHSTNSSSKLTLNESWKTIIVTVELNHKVK